MKTALRTAFWAGTAVAFYGMAVMFIYLDSGTTPERLAWSKNGYLFLILGFVVSVGSKVAEMLWVQRTRR